MSGDQRRLFLTGASGLLGRSIYKDFIKHNWHVFGTALTRHGSNFHKLDLRDDVVLNEAVLQFKPHIVIHAAAQRYPDKVNADPDAAINLNVHVTENLAAICAKNSIPLLYISTDYVFDGKNPPYSERDQPNPLNLYGKTKLQGEDVCLTANPGNIILRIPVLYGPVEQLSESAVTILLELLLKTAKESQVSDYELRRPSHVDDIADICYQLAKRKTEGESVGGIYHWSGKELLTKYQMIQQISDVFNMPHSHIIPAAAPPSGSGATRPYDTTLSTTRLVELNVGHHTTFKKGIKEALQTWVQHKGSYETN